jgi:hypothetical protein
LLAPRRLGSTWRPNGYLSRADEKKKLVAMARRLFNRLFFFFLRMTIGYWVCFGGLVESLLE